MIGPTAGGAVGGDEGQEAGDKAALELLSSTSGLFSYFSLLFMKNVHLNHR